jgi:hypothetical protein
MPPLCIRRNDHYRAFEPAVSLAVAYETPVDPPKGPREVQSGTANLQVHAQAREDRYRAFEPLEPAFSPRH